MKTAISTFIILVLIVTELQAQTNLQDSVKIKLSTDTGAYKLFLELGKCHCLDILFKKSTIIKISRSRQEYSFFWLHLLTLDNLRYAFPRLIKEKEILSVVDGYYNSNMEILFQSLEKRDEKLKITWSSPFLFCERLFEQNDKTKQAYLGLVQDNSSYENSKYYGKYLRGYMPNE